jgi:hypothetical protein
MKIVSWNDFCSLPEGTIFSTYTPHYCGEISRKGSTIFDDSDPIDFFYTPLQAQCWNEGPPTVDKYVTRYGLFDNGLMAIYEERDLQIIKELLS